MITNERFRELALSLEGATEKPHFDRASFRTKRIFATLHEPSRSANFKLNPIDQSAFCAAAKGVAYPVPNKWGQQGWTTIELEQAPEELVMDALQTAYEESK